MHSTVTIINNTALIYSKGAKKLDLKRSHYKKKYVIKVLAITKWISYCNVKAYQINTLSTLNFHDLMLNFSIKKIKKTSCPRGRHRKTVNSPPTDRAISPEGELRANWTASAQ